jgi:uncharacterized protein (DUF1697 family)
LNLNLLNRRQIVKIVTTYVAFLRGINVGGNKLIKMEDLKRAFVSLGFKNVRTFIQSGNVIFETEEVDESVVVKKIEQRLRKSFGHEITVVLRTIEQIQKLVKRSPFKQIGADDDVMLFVAFLTADPAVKPKLPMASTTENLDVVSVRDRAAFIVCRRKKNGWFGFPNNFIEKQLKVGATTRNWTTVSKIAALPATK